MKGELILLFHSVLCISIVMVRSQPVYWPILFSVRSVSTCISYRIYKTHEWSYSTKNTSNQVIIKSIYMYYIWIMHTCNITLLNRNILHFRIIVPYRAQKTCVINATFFQAQRSSSHFNCSPESCTVPQQQTLLN